MTKEKITIYTDGGARGNPGNAGAGAVIFDQREERVQEVSKSLGIKTNNWAEYEGVIIGLEALKKVLPAHKRAYTEIEVKTDSQLIVRQLSGEYQIKEETLFPQFIKVWNMKVKDFPNIKFTHIPREQNKEADRLANEAMDKNE